MRTWAVILIIAAILAGLSVAEISTVSNFCSEIEYSITDICEKIKLENITSADIDHLYSIWERNKTAVFVFSNHHMFTDYEDGLAEMYYYFNHKNTEQLYHTAVDFENVNERLKGSITFNIGNIF